MTRVIALTGGAASGKSTVARWFVEWGATLVDADRIVHQLQVPGTPVFAAIRARFGPGIQSSDGDLDRNALRQVVLADTEARQDLEAIVHPAVAEAQRQQVAAAVARNDAIVVVDIPLLFEVDRAGEFETVVLVEAPADVRVDRLVRARGLSRPEAERLLEAQLPDAVKRGGADHIITNDASLEELEARARRVWRELTR